MKLAVIGDTQHYRDAAGSLCSLEPVVAQLDRWAELFDEVVICAPLDPGPPPTGFAPYRSTNITIRPLSKAGGNTKLAKLLLAPHIVPWALTTRRVARQADVVHLRCPCNIGLVAILSTWRAGAHRYALYAGVWRSYVGEPWTFRLQRRLLASHRFGGPVSVYSTDPGRSHLVPFFSPSFGRDQWLAREAVAARKLQRIAEWKPNSTVRLVTVGRMSANKNQQVLIRGLALMVERGLDARLRLVGDGVLRSDLEQLAASLGVDDRVEFLGEVAHGEVMTAFDAADINLLGTRQEGYGKVLLEGMLSGTVPVMAESPVSAEITGGGRRGLVFDADRPDQLADLVDELVEDPCRWADMAREGRRYAADMTLEAFQDRVVEIARTHWGVELERSASGTGS